MVIIIVIVTVNAQVLSFPSRLFKPSNVKISREITIDKDYPNSPVSSFYILLKVFEGLSAVIVQFSVPIQIQIESSLTTSSA